MNTNGMFNPFNRTMNVIQQFMQFQQTFRGNPQEQVENLLKSGRVSQEQYNAAVQQAKQLQQLLQR